MIIDEEILHFSDATKCMPLAQTYIEPDKPKGTESPVGNPLL